MTKQSHTIVINGKEINVKSFMTTLNNPIEIMDYSKLSYLTNSIIRIVRTALESDTNYHSNLDLSNLLEIVQNLTPYNELELLDIINNNLQNE